MRRLLLQFLLPLILCLAPFLALFLVVVAIPAPALNFYLRRVSESYFDWIILGLGCTLFLLQMTLAWRALQWCGTAFNEKPDRWVSNLAQAAEWFPMLGLLGTVFGILETFNVVASNPHSTPQDIIASYAPAITATGSGLLMALINLFPTWIILVGRDLILSLGGGTPPASEGRS